MQLTKVYGLIPLFNITTLQKQTMPLKLNNTKNFCQKDNIQKIISQIQLQVKKIIGIQSKQSFVVHQMFNDQKCINQESRISCFAVQFKQFKLSFQQLNEIIQLHQQLEYKVNMYEDILKNFDWDKYSLQLSHQNRPNDTKNIESLIKKAKKYKDVKQENKKLKKLLQIQLDNTQKVRQQTQKTMKILRNQFNALVNEMVKQRQKNQKNLYHQNEQFAELFDNINKKN